MARKKNIHAEALKQFDAALQATQDQREASLEDRRFYCVAGAQWEGKYGEQFEERPMLEINKVHNSVLRIFNEYRNNRISAEFVGKTGEEGDELADFCAGLYRADQQDSSAEEAYDNAFQEAVGGGLGAWRLRAEYEDEYDEDNDSQRIRWEPVPDADTCVYFDPNSKRQDKRDARFCFVLTGMTPDAYEEEFDDDPTSWDKGVMEVEFDWCTADLVYIAEYFVVEEAMEEVETYRLIDGEMVKKPKLSDEARREMTVGGAQLVATRKVKRRKVRKYILSGLGVLEDCGHIAGCEIPVIPVYGHRVFIDGREVFYGHTRHVKDAQRLKNMQVSSLAERAAEGGDRTPIMTPEQVSGHEMSWAKRAIKKMPYMLVNPVTDASGMQAPMGPLGYTESADVPQAMAALLQITEEDISDILGNQENGDEIQSNISGRAVELIQSRLDMQTFMYMSNLARAERRCAEIWLSMARDLYDDDRRMKVVDDSGTADFVDTSETYLTDDGSAEKIYDMSRAKFDVTVEIGPHSGTKRQATINALTNMLQFVADPMDTKVITAMIMRNMQGEGIASVREYFRKMLVQMGVEEPTDEDIKQAEEQPPEPPSAQDEYLAAEAQKAQAMAQKAQADTGKALADTEYTQARTAETLASIDQGDRKLAIDAAKAMQDAVTGSGTTAP